MTRPLFSDRHDAGYEGDVAALWNEENEVKKDEPPPWRKRGAMKTAHGALVLCLNIGTDPPGVVKTTPCATSECWLNPHAQSRQKSLEAIGDALQAQYTGLASRTSYQQLLDPPVDDLRRVCQALRRRARSDRVLFHYNGHGVPRPTVNGEIWLFNNDYTQYIPVSLNELRANMVGSPAIYVFDCSGAGQCLANFAHPVPSGSIAEDSAASGLPQHQFRKQQHQQTPPPERNGAAPSAAPQPPSADPPTSTTPWSDAARQEIVLVPCGATESLPMEPQYPADLFTTCLTTPIPMALRWFVMDNKLSMGEEDHIVEACSRVPGRLNDRKTPLGELNWIFTAITDSIAWNCLSRHRFHSLFRQDLMVASLFRNFLLADRVLRSLGCTPASIPALPPNISLHPLWQSWDLAAESCLSNLLGLRIPPAMPPANGGCGGGGVPLLNAEGIFPPAARGATGQFYNQQPPAVCTAAAQGGLGAVSAAAAVSPFFAEQLTAFEVWLDLGSFIGIDEEEEKRISGGAWGRGRDGGSRDGENRDGGGGGSGGGDGGWGGGVYGSGSCYPEQLPMVLQVLLSQTHRLRALQLLRRFFEEVGAPAVLLALNVGIFPYVLKLLQSPDAKLRQALVGIWARILALDRSTQVDLVSAGAHVSFAQHLVWEGLPPEQHVNAAFVLAHMCESYPLGQLRCLEQGLHRTLHALLSSTANFTPPPATSNSNNGLGVHWASSSSSSSSWRRHTAQPPLTLLLRRWLCLCAGSLLRGFSPAQHACVEEGTLVSLLHASVLDPCVEVRAAAVFALSSVFGFSEAAAWPNAAMPREGGQSADGSGNGYGGGGGGESNGRFAHAEVLVALELVSVVEKRAEASPLVRREIAFALHTFATCTQRHKQQLQAAATAAAVSLGIGAVNAEAGVVLGEFAGEPLVMTSTVKGGDADRWAAQAYARVWRALVSLCGDPFPPVAEAARLVATVARESASSGEFLHANSEVLALRAAHGVYRWSCAHFTNETDLGTASNADGKGGREEGRGGSGVGNQGHDNSGAAAFVAGPLSGSGARALYWERRKRAVDASAAEFIARSQRVMADFREGAERLEAEQRSLAQQQHPSGGGGGGGGSGHGRSKASQRQQNQQQLLKQQQLQQQQQRNSIVSPIAAIFRDPASFFRNDAAPSSGGGGKRGEAGAMPVVPKCLSFDQSIILENNSEMTALLLFHPYEALLAVGDDKDGVSLWAFEEGERWWHLRNGNRRGTRITAFEWINEDGPSCLAVASDDGVVRVWGGVLEDDGRTGGGGCGGGGENRDGRGGGDDCDDEGCGDGDSSGAGHKGNGAYGGDDNVSKEVGGARGGSGGGASSGVLGDEEEDFGFSDIPDGPRLVSSFLAVPDIAQWGANAGLLSGEASCYGSGVVTSYSHAAGHLFAGGQSSKVRLWDLNSEACVASWGCSGGGSNPDTAARESKAGNGGFAPCVTALCCAGANHHQASGGSNLDGGGGMGGGMSDGGLSSGSSSSVDAAVVLAGFSDGAVRLFDSRLPSERNCVAVWHEHDAWVVSAHLSLPTHAAVSASVSGDVNFLDLRVSSGPVRSLDVLASSYTGAETSTSLSAFAVHPGAPVLAVGSHAQFIKVLTLDGYVLKWMKYHDGFLGQRIGPVSCLAFHPNRGVMAAGATDSIISVYSNSE